MFRERRQNHRAIRGQKIEDDMTDKNRKADFIKTPEGGAPRYFYKKPAEKKGIEGNQYERMSKVPMVFEIKLPVEETQNKIGVGEKTHGEACHRSPFSNFFITDGFCNNGAGKRMSNRVHLCENVNL